MHFQPGERGTIDTLLAKLQKSTNLHLYSIDGAEYGVCESEDQIPRSSSIRRVLEKRRDGEYHIREFENGESGRLICCYTESGCKAWLGQRDQEAGRLRGGADLLGAVAPRRQKDDRRRQKEEKRREDDRRQKEEARKREEEKRREEECRQKEERRRDEECRLREEKRREDERRCQEESRKREEDCRQKEERRRRDEEEKRRDEERRRPHNDRTIAVPVTRSPLTQVRKQL